MKQIHRRIVLMQPSFRRHTYILVSIFSLFLFTNITIADQKGSFSTNPNYIVSVANRNILVIYDITKEKIIHKEIDYQIGNIEVCPIFPFVSFIGYPKQTPDSAERYFFYDLEKKKLYSPESLLISKYYNRWPKSGEYTCIIQRPIILIIPTKHLRQYLESGTAPEIIEIKGHPLGPPWQVAWINNNLLYGINTGNFWINCYGYLDTEAKKNYLLTCCGMKDKEHDDFSTNCVDIASTREDIVNILISKLHNRDLIEISTDFLNSIGKILEGDDWKEYNWVTGKTKK